MLRIAYGKFKVGRGFDFYNWFRNEDNLRKFKESLPEGVEFKNIYFVDRGADHHFEIVYKISGYAVLDKWNMHNEKFKAQMQQFMLDIGFYTESFNEKFLKTIDEFDAMDEDVFREVMRKEKERDK
ncbi:MAG: hypothetical protein ACW99A_22060 [Candidatus Kariarchaeaceae archaeon]|jgi:hypothetical protein